MKWTKEQQSIIDIREKNILVSAAAGSGKTAVLVERIKDLVIKDRVPLRSMLIVTFTNAAAGEMKQRIVEAMNKELADNEDEFVSNQIQNIYNTHISTFHAFAISILKRYYHIAGIEPSFSIAPENQLEVFKNEALDKLFEKKFEENNPDFIDFMKNYASSKNEEAVRDMILQTFNFIQTIPDSEKWMHESVEELNNNVCSFEEGRAFAILYEQIRYDLNRALSKNEALTEFLEDNNLIELAKKSTLDTAQILNLINTLKDQSFNNFLSEILEYKPQVFRASKDEKETYEELKPIVTKKRDSIKADINKYKTMFPSGSLDISVKEINDTYKSASVLANLVEEFSQIFSKIKREEDLLDFNDVEHLALKVLADDKVSEEYRRKFNYIFIDEYQDTNFIQEAFISRIKREDNLFMVGDVKQSIYKFRRAEPSIFIKRYDDYRGDSDPKSTNIDLNKNFRSKKNIIECINDTFVHVMEKSLSGMEYDENAFLYKGLEYGQEWDNTVDLYVVDSGKLDGTDVDDQNDVSWEDINAIHEAELEAHEIAKIIKEEVGKPIFDVKKDKERKLQFRDIVVLLRAVKGHGSLIYQVLMDHGIPTFSDGGEDYFSTVEIETFLNLLKVIDNKRQDVPLVSAMYSPVFGFTTEELVKIRLSKKTGNYYSAFLSYIEDGDDDKLREKCIDTEKKISKWRQNEAFMALDDFLWMLMNESGYYNYAGALIGGNQRRANLRALVDRASEYSTGKIRGLYGFLRYVDTISSNDIKTGQIKLLSENDNVVRITTVHNSKGLEYPFVIVARLGKKFNRNISKSKVNLDKDVGLALQWEDYESYTYKKTLLSKIINEKEAVEDLAEEIRILYVAMTRAMDKLVLIGSINSGKNDIEDILTDYEDMDIGRDLDIKSASSFLSLLIPVAYNMGIEPKLMMREDIVKSISFDEESKEAKQQIISSTNVLEDYTMGINEDNGVDSKGSDYEEINRRLNFTYPHEKALNLKSKYSVTQLNNIEKEPTKTVTYGLGDDRISKLIPDFLADEIPMTSAERGTALHTVFEKLDFKEALAHRGDPDYISDFLQGLVEKEIMTAEAKDLISIAAINGFIRSQIFERAAGSPNLQKERPFNIKKIIDGETVMVQGIIDCYFEEGDDLVLLDYKSNYIEKNDPKAKDRIVELYREQINLYREALNIITKKNVKESYLFLTGIGEAVEI